MAKFGTNASGAMLLPSLVQVSESISGSVVPLAMFMFRVLRCPKIENGIKRPKMNIHKWAFFEKNTLSEFWPEKINFETVCLKLIFSTRNYPAIANAPEVSERQECQFTHNTKDMLSTWHVTKRVIPVRHEIQILSCSQLTKSNIFQ